MDKTLIICFFLGLAIAASIGVLFSKRIVHAGFALFGMLMAVAGIFACLGIHSATFAQVIIYVGGVIVLVVFALFLNPDPGNSPPKWRTVKKNLGKAFVMCAGLIWILVIIPFSKINTFLQVSPLTPEGGTVSSLAPLTPERPLTHEGPLAPEGGMGYDSTFNIISHPSLTGKELASTFGPEFEIIGLLLLAAIVLAGWYLKTQNETKNR